MAEYDDFYDAMQILLGEIECLHGRFVVYDLHSYSHRRDGPDGAAADPAGNPQVNVGTGTMNRERWAPVVDALIESRPAYTIALRVYRGGGLTKDAVYLRGLVEILDYIRQGGEQDALFVGKLAADHLPVVRELLLRGVLRPPPLRPRYLDDPQASERLQRLRPTATVFDLLDE